eukprot:TRINITY_DN12620_c0_g1_i1.p1 TRINITY_DN12620_c0_g1~~TRINITY_DN12620_c0_g1_i1.p1  ORF type:complete len:212 (-),score=38.81 TRINITY_DN12620_c0_g1_i1:48-632(-)
MKAVLFTIVLICSVLGAVNAKCSSYDHKSFFWKSCANTNSTMTYLDLAPSPLTLGNNFTLGFTGKLGTTISNNTAAGAPFSITLELYKDEVFWVDLCDLVNCKIPDICALMSQKVNAETCALLKSHGLPCGCPITAGTYSVRNFNFPTHNPHLSFLTDGEYCATAVIADNKGGVIGCLEVYAQLSATALAKFLN